MTRRLLTVLALMAALLSPFFASAASASGNDYPYRGDTQSRADRWGFTTRQCTSFAAWRLSQHDEAINNHGNAWGNAANWDNEAKSLHKTISRKPKVGAIAQWNANESSAYYPSGGGTGTFTAGSAGHVAYVSGVYSDGSVRIEQYNFNGSRTYSVIRVKAPRYLYLG